MNKDKPYTKKNLKIHLVSNMYPSSKDSTYGTFVYRFFKNLTEVENVNFIAFSLIKGRGKTSFSKLIKYFSYYISFAFNFLFSKSNICYIHFISHVSPLLNLLNTIKKQTVVINIHGSDISQIHSKLLKNQIKKSLNIADLIIVPSSYFKNYTIKQYPSIDQNKIKVSASGGVDLSVFKKKSSFVETETPTIGYVSRMSAGKGWRTFIDACKFLKNDSIKFSAIMVGGGLEIQQLKRAITDLGLEKEIQVMGSVDHDHLPEVFNKMDIFIFPSELPESLGLVAIEAMACGIPVIGSDSGAIPEYIIEGINGFIYQSKDPNQLSEAIKSYISLPPEVKVNISDNALKTASRYSHKMVTMDLTNLLVDLVNKN